MTDVFRLGTNFGFVDGALGSDRLRAISDAFRRLRCDRHRAREIAQDVLPNAAEKQPIDQAEIVAAKGDQVATLMLDV